MNYKCTSLLPMWFRRIFQIHQVLQIWLFVRYFLLCLSLRSDIGSRSRLFHFYTRSGASHELRLGRETGCEDITKSGSRIRRKLSRWIGSFQGVDTRTLHDFPALLDKLLTAASTPLSQPPAMMRYSSPGSVAHDRRVELCMQNSAPRKSCFGCCLFFFVVIFGFALLLFRMSGIDLHQWLYFFPYCRSGIFQQTK